MLSRVNGAAVAATVLLVGLLFAAAAEAAPSATGLEQANERVCGVPAEGSAHCFAIRHYPGSENSKGGGKPGPVTPLPGYGAADLQSAYGLTTAAATAGAGKTVAIVDAYDDPNAYKDLAVYRKEQGLSSIGACAPGELATSLVPCFSKVNQSGVAGSYPTANTGWAEEISLDVDMVSATCPNCNILLVEAASNSLTNLGAATVTAAGFHPVAIGNSYGGSEFSSEAAFAASNYAFAGVAVTASSGDNGYGVEFPAAASSVIAVGGTSLRTAANARGWTETVWGGAGSGCSAYVAKPSWQHDTSGCARRTVADVAAVADPNTGVKVYDSFNEPGWMVFGGTSASAQIVAGVYGLAGHGASNASAFYGGGSIAFGSPNPLLNDVTSGSNGSCTGHGRVVNASLAYLCTGVTGYDGPTGMGTPIGFGAF
jgi:subtilase family serine protease